MPHDSTRRMGKIPLILQSDIITYKTDPITRRPCRCCWFSVTYRFIQAAEISRFSSFLSLSFSNKSTQCLRAKTKTSTLCISGTRVRADVFERMYWSDSPRPTQTIRSESHELFDCRRFWTTSFESLSAPLFSDSRQVGSAYSHL